MASRGRKGNRRLADYKRKITGWIKFFPLLIALTLSAPAAAPQGRDAHFLGLTPGQRLEDYDFMWASLKEGYPFFGVAGRSGIDVRQIYRTYRERIQDSDSDVEFHNAINGAMRDMQFVGHIQMINVWEYQEYVETYASPPVFANVMPWAQALTAPATKRSYEKTISAFHPKTQEDGPDSKPNTAFEIMERDKTATMKIDSFAGDRVNKDSGAVLGFYQQVRDYENLIIDLTDNGGGADRYWERLIVAPNISETVYQTEHMLFNACENNQKYVDARFAPSDVKPLSLLPAAGLVRKSDIAGLSHFATLSYPIKPRTGTKAFRGKVWILVGENVYSASESFARFCKETGFATLVGAATGGDGGGIDPVFITLPNSGYLIRHSMMYTINPDGTNNEEYGTTPDIAQARGQTALEVCLEAIG